MAYKYHQDNTLCDHSWVADADHEPLLSLKPIEGCETVNIGSFEDAVKPIKHLLPAIGVMAEMVSYKQYSRAKSDELTLDQSAAIRLFTFNEKSTKMYFSYFLNSILRSTELNRNAKLEGYKPYLRLFFAALNQLPTTRTTVYRGVLGDVIERYPVGGEFIWWGFTTCTSSMEAVSNTLHRDTKGTVFSIICVNGKDIQHHSYDETEEAVLLFPGTRFKVITHSEISSNQRMIHLYESKPWPTYIKNSDKRILVIGTAGVGKSSLINLLAGHRLAPVSDNASGCTLTIQSYFFSNDNVQYAFIDTIGLNPSSRESVNDEESLRRLLWFIKRDNQDFQCVLFVTRKGRMSAMFDENYFILIECFIGKKIPTILVVTGCEWDKPLNQWKTIAENREISISIFIFAQYPNVFPDHCFSE